MNKCKKETLEELEVNSKQYSPISHQFEPGGCFHREEAMRTDIIFFLLFHAETEILNL